MLFCLRSLMPLKRCVLFFMASMWCIFLPALVPRVGSWDVGMTCADKLIPFLESFCANTHKSPLVGCRRRRQDSLLVSIGPFCMERTQVSNLIPKVTKQKICCTRLEDVPRSTPWNYPEKKTMEKSFKLWLVALLELTISWVLSTSANKCYHTLAVSSLNC